MAPRAGRPIQADPPATGADVPHTVAISTQSKAWSILWTPLSATVCCPSITRTYTVNQIKSQSAQ